MDERNLNNVAERMADAFDFTDEEREAFIAAAVGQG